MGLATVLVLGIVLAVGVGAVVLLGSDGDGRDSGVTGTVEAFFAAAEDGNCPTMLNLVVATSRPSFPACASLESGPAIASLDSTEVQREDHDQAVVQATVTIEIPRPPGDTEQDGDLCDYGDRTDACAAPAEVHLVREDGSWKIRALTLYGRELIRPLG